MKQYKTVLADPPWNEKGGGKIKRGADKHYPLMRTSEIIKYMQGVPIADDAHIYLWVTNNFLEDGLKVLSWLGFRYVTNLVWVKRDKKLGLGQYYRGQHELLLFGVKGKLPYKNKINAQRSSCNLDTIIHARRREHSRKPDEQYTKIEATSYPPYLEVFARRRRDGWDTVGDEEIITTQRRLDFGKE